MIRDPSDGSVKPPMPNLTSAEPMPLPREMMAVPDIIGPVIDTTTSGLPPASARDADRHARSREWLKNYRKDRK